MKYAIMALNILILTIIDLVKLILVLLQLPIYFLVKDEKVKLYIRNLLVSIDQGYNVVWGGSPDETISSRLGRYKDKNIFAKYCSKFVDFIFGKGHCRAYVEADDHHKDDILK